jgi:Clostripain family
MSVAIEINAEPEVKNPQREWTLMFYFASDNPLAISIVSQLKALKAAGYHHDANVIAQFDPSTEGTPTHIFDVNLIEKLKNPGRSNIGFAPDNPFVRTLLEDKLWRDQKTEGGRTIRSKLRQVYSELSEPFVYEPAVPPNVRTSNGTNGTSSNPTATAALESVLNNPKSKVTADAAATGANGTNGHKRPQELNPRESLKEFLHFCAEKYPAKHYMLFILGHGVVVGNDMFLFDEHAEIHTLKLGELSDELQEFKKEIAALPVAAELELISFHSCSVSSLEVAYELRGKANYMLASQGPTFVGSWPYRQILLRIFREIKTPPQIQTRADIKTMLTKVFYYCLFNSADYLLAGYSHHLVLCDLTNLNSLNEPITELTKLLTENIEDPSIQDHIQLAHLKSQSFFQEMYTDLYDFCFCLSAKLTESVEQIKKLPIEPAQVEELTKVKKQIIAACKDVMLPLVAEDRRLPENMSDEPLVILSEFAGPSYQYSHGLSVYFPWSQPAEDREIMEQYENYTFTKEFKESSWFKFLTAYFEKTMRKTVETEADQNRSQVVKSEKRELQEEAASLLFVGEGLVGNDSSLTLAKDDPRDRTGGDCDCPSIKNYPRDTRRRRTRRNWVQQGLPMGNYLVTDESFVE